MRWGRNGLWEANNDVALPRKKKTLPTFLRLGVRNNFDDTRNQKRFVCRRFALKLRNDVESLMSRLVKAIPQAYDNDSYYERSELLKNELGKAGKNCWRSWPTQPREKGEVDHFHTRRVSTRCHERR